MKKLLKISGVIFVLLFFLLVFFYYLTTVSYQIGFKEQLGIFVADNSFYAMYLQKPAILSEFLGDFLTQFFSVRPVPQIILLLLLVATWSGIVKLLKLCGASSNAYIWALLPVIPEVAFIVFLNYPLSATIGLLIAIWMTVALCSVKCALCRRILHILAIPLLYILIGSGVLLFIVSLLFVHLKDWKVGLGLSLTGLLFIILIGHFCNLTLSQSLLYPIIDGYVLPVTKAFLLLPLALLFSLLSGRFKVPGWIAVIPIAVSLFFAIRLSYNKNLEYSAEIGTHAYNDNWDRVKMMSINNKSNNLHGIYYRNLIFAREGKLAKELFKHTQVASDGLFMDLQPGVTFLDVFYYMDVLLEVGDISQATDCALFCPTVMPKSYSSRGIKNLAEIAMIVNDREAAEKYLWILSRTSMHKKWALEMKECLETDSLPEEYQIYRERIPRYDYLYQQNNWLESLKAIADANPLNKVAIDYLLCGTLLNKNYQTFLSMYDRYYLNKLDRVVQVPEIYLQALLLQATDDESLKAIMEKYNIPQVIVEHYFAFVDMQAQVQGDVTRLNDFFGTYWLYMLTAKFNN